MYIKNVFYTILDYVITWQKPLFHTSIPRKNCCCITYDCFCSIKVTLPLNMG